LSEYGVGEYPELDYSRLDYHESSWLNHIVRNLESNVRSVWHGISMNGIMSFMTFSERDKDRVEHIKKRLPNLRIVVVHSMSGVKAVGGGVYWVKDADAYARLMQILLKEREDALFYVNSIDVALRLPKDEEAEKPTYNATLKVVESWHTQWRSGTLNEFRLIEGLMDTIRRMAGVTEDGKG
jgi:hypothetical protein